MKHKILIFLYTGIILLSSCSQKTSNTATTELPPKLSIETSSQPTPYLNDAIYIGEYLDSDVEEPFLEIEKDDSGKYQIIIGIYRLAYMDDGIGELTADGMYFTATDPAGNPISGIITIKDQTATVTFTDSTWEYLKNGDTFYYTKSSDCDKS